MPTELKVTLADIAEVFEALTAEPQDGKFAVIVFGANGAAPQVMDPYNIQFSIEDGRVGLDWILLAPLNVAAREQVATWLQRRGWDPQALEMNDVEYLRVEGGDLASLCRALLSELFGVRPTQTMYLIPEGFRWPP